MSAIQIIVGSMLGGTEYVGEACEETLNELDHNVDIHLKPDLNSILENTFLAAEDLKSGQQNNNNSSNKSLWIICTSTHGAGEYPDNIKQFVSDLTNCDQDLSTVSFLTIGIGDSNYDTFCKAAKDISNLLISKGCNELAPLKTFDMSQDIDPEDLAQQWIRTNKDLL
ncbi:flavodoxin domain-containing protein [Colwellia echini]|uniref:MioC protein n=1 Tax=Colwellia echini TaxID=1982103 RepID=A0ABY3MX68_9GAMM|nr:flavodoxin domain-containing protein [Colwellia echini]TYK65795.1 mioC protein [Colwellia echini]